MAAATALTVPSPPAATRVRHPFWNCCLARAVISQPFVSIAISASMPLARRSRNNTSRGAAVPEDGLTITTAGAVICPW